MTQTSLALLDVFQYFLGNTDWSALAGPAGEECCHNVVPYVRADGVLVPVPVRFRLGRARQRAARAPRRAFADSRRSATPLSRPMPHAGRARADLRALRSAAARRSSRLFGEQSGLSAKVADGARGYVEAFYSGARRSEAARGCVLRRLRALEGCADRSLAARACVILAPPLAKRPTSRAPRFSGCFRSSGGARYSRSAAAYSVGAWVIVQLTDVMHDDLHLPEGSTLYTGVVALIGLPIAIAVSWIYDLTPQGFKATRRLFEGSSR